MHLNLLHPGWFIEQPVSKSNGLYQDTKRIWRSVRQSATAIGKLCYLIPFLIFLVLVVIAMNIITVILVLPLTAIYEELIMGFISIIPFNTTKTYNTLGKTYARFNRKLLLFDRLNPVLKKTIKFHKLSKVKFLTFGSYIYVRYSLNLFNRYRVKITKIQNSMLSHMPVDTPVVSGWKTRTPEEVYKGRSGVYDFVS